MVSLFDKIAGVFGKNGHRWAERRRNQRVRLVDHHLFYMKDSLVDTRARRAEIFDVSRDGVCFVTDEEFRVGDELAIKLQIPFRSRYIRATGRVARILRDPDRVGFRVALRYQPLLAGPDEILYDTILELLVREGGGGMASAVAMDSASVSAQTPVKEPGAS